MISRVALKQSKANNATTEDAPWSGGCTSDYGAGGLRFKSCSVLLSFSLGTDEFEKVHKKDQNFGSVDLD